MNDDQARDTKILGLHSIICEGAEEYIPILREVQQLQYDEEPNYHLLKSLLVDFD